MVVEVLPLIASLVIEESKCEIFEKKYSACVQEIYQTKFIPPSSLKFEVNHFRNFCNKRTKETSTCFRLQEASCSVLFLCVRKLYVVHTKKE